MITATDDEILPLKMALWRARLTETEIAALRILINKTGMWTTARETIDWLDLLEGR